jgi:putative flippase GtrA
MVARASQKTEMVRVGKFGIVGVLNTLIDFTLYNVLQHYGLARLVANTISTTVAMIFSFFANRQVVFVTDSKRYLRDAAMFFVFTAFGLYVLQNGTIWLLVSGPLHPLLNGGLRAAQDMGITHATTNSFLINNLAKVVATAVSLTWNYLTYKRWVFNHGK